MSVDQKSHIILKLLVILESVLRYTLYTLELQSERHLSRHIALSHYKTQKPEECILNLVLFLVSEQAVYLVLFAVLS